jgi:hypothetical protein
MVAGMADDGDVYEMRREMIDVTMSGILGGEPSVYKEVMPGPVEYLRNGEPITAEEYEAAMRMRERIEAWRLAPIGLDGHRWPCPRAKRADAPCTDEGCGR